VVTTQEIPPMASAELSPLAPLASDQERERSLLADVFHLAPSFMAVLRGPRHVFELANDRYLDLVGRRDIVGRPVREALPEIEGQGFFELLDRVYATGEPFVGRDVRALIRREAAGALDERFIDFVYQPMRGHGGAVEGIFVHGVDVTDHKRAEAAVRESEERFRAAFEQAAVGMVLADLKGRITRVNDAFCRLVGYSADELIGRDSADYTHPDDRGPNVGQIGRIEAGEAPAAVYQKRYIRKDGTTVWAQISLAPTRGHDGRLSGIIALAEDVTDRKLAEAQAAAAREELAGSEARFRQLADAMPQIVFAARPDGHVDYFNRRWYQYTGLPEGEVGFESWRHVHEPEGLERVVPAWAESLKTGRPYQIEYRLRRADGEFRWHLGRALPVRDGRGEIVRWFGTNTDIHDYKLLQEQNEQLLDSERHARAEAERASRMKDDFLATLSHELRTPLNAILGWSQILSTGGAPEPQDLEEGLAVIGRNARAQTQIIEDLLDMSRIISGKVRLDVRPLDVAAVVRAALDTVRHAAEAKTIRLQSALDPTAGGVVGDPNRLQQVFWNLLSNAIKFTPAGGHVQVSLRCQGGHVEVAVADTGQGITAEFLPYVFDRFRQADASTTRQHGGLGLGLSIVKHLVELHGGSVRAASGGAGRGATFTVSLPQSAARAGPHQPAARSSPAREAPAELYRDARRHLRDVDVLVVDDEADARAVVRRLLEDCGAAVRTASSARDAMDLFCAKPPDVLVCDIGMPGEDGYSLIRRVRTLGKDAGGAVPALALTAYARAEDRMRAVLAGFQMHVVKPVEPVEQVTMVASLARRVGE
jgi:PAS domain S-box-containing protein